jgi:release factor glutamine methyltransferase
MKDSATILHLTVRDLLLEGTGRLTASDSALLDAELLLARALGRTRSHLLTHPEQRVDEASIEHYRELIEQRRAAVPVAYILGQREFWSLALTVTPAVLIPRPETELAVERCLALLANDVAEVADLGCGSGAITLALAMERHRWRVVATDLSPQALQIARHNAAQLRLRNVEFLQGDWFAPLSGRRFALIVSNPPYVAGDDVALTALQHEPRLALTPGPTGLEAFETIVGEALPHLLPSGWLVLEHGADQAAAVAKMLVNAGFSHVRCHTDLAGRDRVTEAQRP